jgi:mannose-1-phosphate guanylyltransferase
VEIEGSVWVVVLAAGDGTRLQSVTSDARMGAAPKQFCRLVGDETMLARTLARAARIVPPERVLVVVAEKHRGWWEHELRAIPAENVLIQPANKGTAVGILLPLTVIAGRNPDATVLVLPSDHFVADEEALAESIAGAIRAVRGAGKTVLLGMTPEGPDTGYGWIVPERGHDRLLHVLAFSEKPNEQAARTLMGRGALWNSFLIAANVRHLLSLYARTCSDILKLFMKEVEIARGSVDLRRLSLVYEPLPVRDFSRDVLQHVPEELSVWTVPPCGWTDLGTPARLRECLASAISEGSFVPVSLRPGAAVAELVETT